MDASFIQRCRTCNSAILIRPPQNTTTGACPAILQILIRPGSGAQIRPSTDPVSVEAKTEWLSSDAGAWLSTDPASVVATTGWLREITRTCALLLSHSVALEPDSRFTV